MPDRPDHRDKLYAAIAAPPKRLPPKVDLRANCSPVEDQGQLGSCTANALVGNLEFLQKKGGCPVTDFSRLFIYYNERSMEGTINEDAGAMIRDGVQSLVQLGGCGEKKWPYNISTFTKKPSAACYKEATNHQVTSYHRILGLQQMKQCLAEGYPFVSGFPSMWGSSPKRWPRPASWICPSQANRVPGQMASLLATLSWLSVTTTLPSAFWSATHGC